MQVPNHMALVMEAMRGDIRLFKAGQQACIDPQIEPVVDTDWHIPDLGKSATQLAHSGH